MKIMFTAKEIEHLVIREAVRLNFRKHFCGTGTPEFVISGGKLEHVLLPIDSDVSDPKNVDK